MYEYTFQNHLLNQTGNIQMFNINIIFILSLKHGTDKSLNPKLPIKDTFKH